MPGNGRCWWMLGRGPMSTSWGRVLWSAELRFFQSLKSPCRLRKSPIMGARLKPKRHLQLDAVDYEVVITASNFVS
ncbi:hypothetical protein D9M68_681300 [compost metagenome]